MKGHLRARVGTGVAACALALLGISAGLTACSGGGGSDAPISTAKPVLISGKINGVTLMGGHELVTAGLTDNYVSCMVLGSVPIVANTSALESDGAFSLSLSMDEGDALGCFLRRSALSAGFIPLVFETAPSMNDGAEDTSVQSLAPRPDTTAIALGSITVGAGPGGALMAKPDASPVENGTAAAPIQFSDMTGTWKISNIRRDAANHYIHPCELSREEMSPSEYQQCMSAWQSVYVHTFRATAGGKTRWGIALWDSLPSFVNCGRSEALEVDAGFVLDPTSSDAATLLDVYPDPMDTLSLNAVDSMLAKAPFSFWTASDGRSNCPYGDKDYPGCATAATCADFDFTKAYKDDSGDSVVPGPEMQGQAKVLCVMNRLVSGREAASYDWGSSCARRVSGAIWQNISFDSSNYTVNGCVNADCSGGGHPGLSATSAFENNPLRRMFVSELVVSGNIGTATQTERDQRPGCHIARTVKITTNQSSAKKATFLVEFQGAPIEGAFDPETCMNDPEIKASLESVQRMKFDLTR